jgi:hypothetical protein
MSSSKWPDTAHERPTDHPNAPYDLQRKAKAKAKRDAVKHRLAMAPNSLDAARAIYLRFCEADGVDLDGEMRSVVDGLHEIAGRKIAGRRA